MKANRDSFTFKKADYRIGDEVWVKGVVCSTTDPVSGEGLPLPRVSILSSQDFGNVAVWVRSEDIVRHIPAPRPVEVGCFVTGGAAGSNWYRVHAIHGDRAWIECVGLHEIVPTSVLTRMPDDEDIARASV